MAKRVQILRDTATNVNAFVGREGELEVDLTNWRFVVHTGGGAGTQKTFYNKAENDTLYQTKSAFLSVVASLSGTAGIVISDGAANAVARTLTGTANQVSVANGTGAAGNPTISLASTLALPGSLSLSAGGLTVTGQATSLSTTTITGLSGTLLGTLAAGTKQVTGGDFPTPIATIQALGSLGAGTTTVDLSLGTVVTVTQTANKTYTFSNPAASGKHMSGLLEITFTTLFTVTITNGAWDSVSGAPTLVANKINKIYFETIDGGTTYSLVYLGSF